MAFLIKALHKNFADAHKTAPKNGKKFTLGELQAAVGGYIEVVRLSGNERIVVNEEGLLVNLPPNLVASRMAGFLIVGDALLMGPDEKM
jgi:hypothetical protein